MRFGLFIPQGWRLDLVGIAPEQQWPVMRDLAQRADAGPWESLWVFDHFHTVPAPTEEATHEAWTLMAAFAASTQRIRLGQMCTCMAYRNPAYLAKVAATVDHVSAGRVEMGIGAGWYEHEWRAYGYGFPSAGERLGMLEEGVQIMQQAWTQGISTFNGKHYQVDGAICRPLPLQGAGGPSANGGPAGGRGIPMWIAGGGEKRTLRIAAQYAMYSNFDTTPEVFQHKSEVLAGHCRDIGRDFDSIVRSGNYNVVIGTSDQEVQDKLARIGARLAPLLPPDRLDRYLKSVAKGPLVGTPEQIVERLTAAQVSGLSYAIINFLDHAYDPTSSDLFEREVIPELS